MSFSLKRRTCWCRNWQLRGIQSEWNLSLSIGGADELVSLFFAKRVTMQLPRPANQLLPRALSRIFIIRMGVGKRTSHFPLVEMQHKGERQRARGSSRRLPACLFIRVAIIFHNALAICIFIYSTCASGRSAPRQTESNVFSHFAAHGAEKWRVPGALLYSKVSNQLLHSSNIYILLLFLKRIFLVAHYT